MTRRAAADRLSDVTPPENWPPTGEALADAIRALSHPGRRALLDSLSTHGPASVGQLARRTGMAVGSASHHLKVLARSGFITPAPDLAGDTRESWWRTQPRSLSWGEDTFTAGTAGAELAHLAGAANLDYLLGRIRAWQQHRADEEWTGTVSDTVVSATQAQLDDLNTRLAQVISAWSRDCTEHPGDGPRRPVRAIAVAFPEQDL